MYSFIYSLVHAFKHQLCARYYASNKSLAYNLKDF